MKTHKLYQELITAAGIKSDLKKNNAAIRFVMITTVLKVMILLFGVTAVLLLLIGDKLGTQALITFIVLALLYFFIRTRQEQKVVSLVVDKCDPLEAVSTMLSMMPFTGKKKNFALNAYNTASYLFYAGEFDRMQRVIAVMEKMEDKTTMVEVEIEILWCKLFFQKKDRDELQKHIKKLWELHEKYQSSMFEGICELTFKYPDFLLYEQEGSFQKAYDAYGAVKADSNIMEVRKNYAQYEMAVLMGNTELAESHRQAVLAKGGSTWYRGLLA